MSEAVPQLPPPMPGTQRGPQTPPGPAYGTPRPGPVPQPPASVRTDHPAAGPRPTGQRPAGQRPADQRPADQRPLVVGLAVCLSSTAAMLFLSAFGLVWMIALAMRETFDYNDPTEGVLYHMAERLHLRLLQGLAWPLILLPVLTVIAGFLLLIRRSWPRLVYSGLGLAALAWSSSWLQHDLRLWAPAAVYVTFAILIVWHRSATAWYAGSSTPPTVQPGGRVPDRAPRWPVGK